MDTSRGASRVLSLALMVLCLAGSMAPGDTFAKKAKEEPAPAAGVTLPEDVGQAIQQEATKVKAHFALQARDVFKREPLGFGVKTLNRMRQWVLDLPAQVPTLMQRFFAQIRLLGVVGSLILLAFLGIVFYSVFGWKKVFVYLEEKAKPLEEQISEASLPYLLALLRIIAATLIPLILYGLFLLVQAFIAYTAPWLLLTESLLKLWALGALLIGLLWESLRSGMFFVPTPNALTVYRVAKWVILYILFCVALFIGAKVFAMPPDILALLRFAISLSIVLASLLLLMKKNAILAILPELPYKTYQVFYRGLARLYYPALFLTFLTGIMWCLGYKNFAVLLWQKTWAVAGAFVVIMFAFHKLRMVLHNWLQKKEPTDTQAVVLHRSLHQLLVFSIITATAIIILELLGLFQPIQSFVSFPLVIIGNKPISLWTIFKVSLIIVGIIFVSRLLRSYLDYQIYPLLGVDEGLAYSINALLSYLLLFIGILIALAVVGLDIRTFMVFAGAIGIGIGLGLQKIASNLISGFIIIFGRKIRKGDWIKVGDTVGYVQRMGLGATNVMTRDNIECIIPNTDLITSTIINYTLSSPEVRVHIPVGVSYNANPREVRRILLEAAEKNEHIKKTKKPRVWFSEYGDSAINFELLVWIDMRQISEKQIRSQLYFEIFEAFEKAGIEIPFPQRDIHIRSGFVAVGRGEDKQNTY